MTNKHFGWHKAWQRTESGRLWHESGLQLEFDEVLGWHTCDETLDAFQAFEQARGVPLHDIQSRLMRLVREACEWDAVNQ